MDNFTPRDSRAVAEKIAANIAQVMHGQAASIRRLLAAFASGGHVLLDDFPGTGKTTLAKALARSIDAPFQRIQFTHILLADEINRASPRTQSALLEAMAEGQVSVEGQRRQLPNLFFVIATQNPVEFRGTYPLPEAQMDRFAMQFTLGYVTPEEEVSILTSQAKNHPLDRLEPCVSLEEVTLLKEAVTAVRVSDELKRYMVDLVGLTRTASGVQLGASPRASLALMKTAQALALLDGLDYVTPDQVQDLAVPVIAHRLVLDPQARFSGATTRAVVEEALKKIPAPA